MVQNLNNNLITAPELADLRKRLRNLDSRVSGSILHSEIKPFAKVDCAQEGQIFFTSLFRSWTHNAVATFSLCLLAQAYEQAYSLLQIFADLEMTLPMLIQIDKLVQLLESPVFTYLRLQLLEPERYPFLYKCLYGLLMLLPQSSAFAALKNRLNSVSAIGYLHVAAVGGGLGSGAGAREGSLQPGRYATQNFPCPTHPLTILARSFTHSLTPTPLTCNFQSPHHRLHGSRLRASKPPQSPRRRRRALVRATREVPDDAGARAARAARCRRERRRPRGNATASARQGATRRRRRWWCWRRRRQRRAGLRRRRAPLAFEAGWSWGWACAAGGGEGRAAAAAGAAG